MFRNKLAIKKIKQKAIYECLCTYIEAAVKKEKNWFNTFK